MLTGLNEHGIKMSNNDDDTITTTTTTTIIIKQKIKREKDKTNYQEN